MRRANSADVSASYHKYVEKSLVSVSHSFNNTYKIGKSQIVLSGEPEIWEGARLF